jgi:hypothetical protein
MTLPQGFSAKQGFSIGLFEQTGRSLVKPSSEDAAALHYDVKQRLISWDGRHLSAISLDENQAKTGLE